MNSIGTPANPALDVRDLRVVLALHRAGTTSAAAELLHLTQSAVSRALSAAETHAGLALFERTPKGLEPTSAGRLLIDEAPSLLAGLCSLEKRLHTPDSQARRVRLVASCAMIYPWLTRAIVQLEQMCPDLHFEVRPEYADAVAAGFESGRLDMAFMTGKPPARLPRVRLFEDELLFVVSKSHPLATRDDVSPDDLLDQVLLVPAARNEDDWFIRSLFGRRRPKLRVRRLPITEAMVELARAGFGIAVLNDGLMQRYLRGGDPGLHILRPTTGPLLRRWTLVHRPELGDLVPILRDVVLSSKPMTRGLT